MIRILLFLLFITSNVLASDYCTSDAKGCWLYTEGSGTTVADTTPNGNTGNFSSSGHPTWTSSGLPAAYMHYATSSAANTDYVNAGSGTSIDNLSQISISVWVKGSGTSGAQFIMSKFATGSYPTGWAIYFNIQTASTAYVAFDRGFSTTTGAWRTSSTITHTNWNHIVITYNKSSTSNDPIIYINGVSQTITKAQAPVGTATDESAGSLFFGRTSDSTYKFDGQIGEAAVFDRILTSTEVSDIYNNGLYQPVVSGISVLGTSVWDNAVFQ